MRLKFELVRWLLCLMVLGFICLSVAHAQSNLPGNLGKYLNQEKTIITAPTDSADKPIDPQELEQAVSTLTQLLEDSKQQQQLLQQLKQVQTSAALLAEQQSNANQDNSAQLNGVIPSLKNILGFWQKRFETAKLEIVQSYSKIFSWRLLLLLVLATVPLIPLSLWIKRLLRKITSKYSFNKSARLSRLFNKHHLKRVSRYLVNTVLPVFLLFLLTYYTSISPSINSALHLDKSLLWLILLRLTSAVLFTVLLVMLFPLIIQSNGIPLANKFLNKIFGYILLLNWLIGWGSILSLPQASLVFGPDLLFLVRSGLNIAMLLLIAWLVLYFKPVISFLILYKPSAERRKNKKVSHIRRILATAWFIPLLFLVAISLLSILLGDDKLRVFDQSMLSSLVSFVGITFYILIGHFIRIKEHYQILTVYQETANRLRILGLVLLRSLLCILLVNMLLHIWGSSFEQLEAVFGFPIARALFFIFTVIVIAWLAIIAVDNYMHQYLITSKTCSNSARMQTILPLVNNGLKVLIILAATLVLMSILGLNITPLLAGAGILGLAIGFGAQSLVLDIITGVFILIEDSISIGDYIITTGHAGTVERFTLRTVALRDLDGVLHVLPFSQVKGVQNLSREVGYSMLRIPVPYDVPVDVVIDLLQQSFNAVKANSSVSSYIWSRLEMQGIENFSAGIPILRARFETEPFRQWQVARQIHLDLKRRFERNNINWAVPHVSIDNNAKLVTTTDSERSAQGNNLQNSVQNLTKKGLDSTMIPSSTAESVDFP